MGKWRRDWALFDILVLGLGVGLSAIYLVYRSQNPSVNTPFFELWSNTAAGIVGAWISVRIFDALIRSRDKRHDLRKYIVGNLNYIASEAQKLLPRLYDFSLIALRNEWQFQIDHLPKRQARGYLDSEEAAKLQIALNKLNQLIDSAENCVGLDRNIGNIRDHIDQTIDSMNERRAELRNELQNVNMRETRERAEEIYLYLEKVVTDQATDYSPSEIEQIRKYSQTLHSSVPDSDENGGFVRVPIDNPQIKTLYYSDLKRLSEIEKKYNYIRDNVQLNLEEIRIDLTHSERSIPAKDFPQALIPVASRYIAAVRQLAEKRVETEAMIPPLLEALKEAQQDILEESELE